MLVEKYGIDELKLVFEPEDLEWFEAERKKSMEVKKVFSSLKGTIIEPTAVTVKPNDDGTYPLEALVQGAAWPPGIDCAKREQYLSDADFQSVFKMTKQEFMAKDKFIRIRLKKENRLF